MYHIAPIWHFVDFPLAFSAPQPSEPDVIDYRALSQHIQFNLVMAIGKLLENTGPHDQLPGEELLYFALFRMEKSTQSISMAREPILTAQNYTLIAFYFHAVNRRNDAYISMGKAMRIAFTQGLHRISSPTGRNPEHQEHLVRLWWSMYSLDMVLTSLMGGPVSVHIDEITTPEPSATSALGDGQTLLQCVKMARLTAVVLSGLLPPLSALLSSD
jgi:hypothetical protein